MTCELTGIKGAISNDGQAVTVRRSILLKNQARTYGGDERAAAYIEQNRADVLKNARYSDLPSRTIGTHISVPRAKLGLRPERTVTASLLARCSGSFIQRIRTDVIPPAKQAAGNHEDPDLQATSASDLFRSKSRPSVDSSISEDLIFFDPIP